MPRLPASPLAAAIGVGACAEALFCWRLTTPHSLVFDEIHYVPAARTLLTLAHPANIEHPLFGKTLLAIGITLFGDGPLGWRMLSTFAGTATVVGAFAILWLLFGRMRTAIVGSLLVLLNFTVFVQARIAMLDGFMAALVVSALAAMLWAMRRGGPARWLLGCVLLGLAAGTKWTAIPYIVYAGAAFLVVRTGRPHAWPGLRTMPALVILGVGSGVAYAITFAPAFFYADRPLTLATLIPFQAVMYAEQVEILPLHTYQSAWWTWPLILRPIWYLYEMADGAVRGILMIGNPAILWGGLVAVGSCTWAWARQGSARLGAIGGLWIGSYGMWAIIPKSLGFFYYYYLSSIWLALAIAAAFDHFAGAGRKGWDTAFLLVAAALFVYFYPILSAAPLPGGQAFLEWMWFDRWR